MDKPTMTLEEENKFNELWSEKSKDAAYCGAGVSIIDRQDAIELVVSMLASRPPLADGEEKEILDALEVAHQMVSDLDHQKREWIMSIPARPNYDPDLVIGKALRLASRFLSRRVQGGSDKAEQKA